MLAYIYQAALLCEDCGKAARTKCHEDDSNVVVRIARERNCSLSCAAEYESHYDSDDYPKGPFDNGGGEADSPQHCDHCGVFLENDLTTDGAAYVRESDRDTSVNVETFAPDGDYADIETDKAVREVMRDFAQWIYDSLRREYEWLTEAEQIDESIEANEWRFYEDGRLA